MGLLLVGDLTLYFLALALLAGLFFLLLSLRLRHIDESLEGIAHGLREVSERLEQGEERLARVEEGLSSAGSGEAPAGDPVGGELAGEILERLDALVPGAHADRNHPGERFEEDALERGSSGAELLDSIRGEVQAQLGSFASSLDEQLEVLRGSIRAVVQEELQTVVLFPSRAPSGDPEQIAKEFLSREGFQRISILSGTVDREVEDLTRMTVEAVREDVVHKGVLTVHEGEVVDVELRPTYPMFP